MRFYNFRKKIHGPATITIVAIYTAGFYMLTPELCRYFDKWIMVLMDVSYIVVAMVLI